MIKTVFQPHHIEYMSGQTFWIKMTYKFTMRHFLNLPRRRCDWTREGISHLANMLYKENFYWSNISC